MPKSGVETGGVQTSLQGQEGLSGCLDYRIPPRRITPARGVFADSFATHAQKIGEEVMAKHSLRVRLSCSTVSVLRVACLGAVSSALLASPRCARRTRTAAIGLARGQRPPSRSGRRISRCRSDCRVRCGNRPSARMSGSASAAACSDRALERYGETPLHIGAAHIALAATMEGYQVRLGSRHHLRRQSVDRHSARSARGERSC